MYKHIGHPEPIEWATRDGKDWPVFRMALLCLPINPLQANRQGLKIQTLTGILELLPKDTQIVDARYGQGFGQEVEYLVQSKEFPENTEGAHYPRITLRRGVRVLTPEEVEAEGATCSVQESYTGWEISGQIW